MSAIVHVPNKILNTSTREVKHFDKKLEMLVARMKKILLEAKKPKGVGLSANQIGESYSVFITKPTTQSEIRVFINPIIIKSIPDSSKNTKDNNRLEGCLSIPNVWGYVERAKEVILQYQDILGQQHEEKISGFLATIIQHETDHLAGILFSQRVVEQKGKFYQIINDNNGNEILEEIKTFL